MKVWSIIVILVADIVIADSNPMAHEQLRPDDSSLRIEEVSRLGYALGYSPDKRQPLWVAYRLRREDIEGNHETRQNCFKLDAKVSNSPWPYDYYGSGYDRGHMAPAKDMEYNKERMEDSFFMSNMSPQLPYINRVKWKGIEDFTISHAIKFGEVFVATGPIFEGTDSNLSSQDKSIELESGDIPIPKAFYKVLYTRRFGGMMLAFQVENDVSAGDWRETACKVSDIEKQTQLHFFPDVDANGSLGLRNESDMCLFNQGVIPMNKLILKSCMIAGLLLPTLGKSGSAENSREEAERAVVLLNHLNWVVSRVEQNKDDAFVIEEEYENLTDNNINLAMIEDEEIAQEIVALMRVFTDIRETIMDMDALHGVMELKRKAAIYRAIPNPGVVVSPNPYLIAIRLAESAATSFMNYQTAKSEMLIEEVKEKLDIDKRKMRAMDAINEELFWRQWQIVQKHKLPDHWRTARSDCRELVALLSITGDNADELIYSYLKRHEARFSYLPIYWYYRAQYAMKDASRAEWAEEKRQDAMRSCKQFEQYHKDILRKDRVRAMVSMMAIGAAKGQMDRSELERNLNIIVENMKTHDWDLAYFAAKEYVAIGKKKEAHDLLQGMVDNLEAFYLKYDASEHVFDVATMKNLEPVDKRDGKDPEVRKANFPSQGLFLCRLLLCGLKKEINQDEGQKYAEAIIEDAGKRNVSIYEKLECVSLLGGKMPYEIQVDVQKLTISINHDELKLSPLKTWGIGLKDKICTKVVVHSGAKKKHDVSPDFNQKNESGSHYDKKGDVICKLDGLKAKDIAKVEVTLQFGGKNDPQGVRFIYEGPFSKTTQPTEVYLHGARIL